MREEEEDEEHSRMGEGKMLFIWGKGHAVRREQERADCSANPQLIVLRLVGLVPPKRCSTFQRNTPLWSNFTVRENEATAPVSYHHSAETGDVHHLTP